MLVGKQFGPFKVEKELGSGAMGSVYRGVDENGKRVAIKIISTALSGNEKAIERFLRESAVLKRLKHPNIAKYLGSGRYHGTPFYIMEFIKGESLDRVLERRVKLTWEEVVEIGKQLCGALQTAHDAGVIHRDLKPSNLMLLADGVVKLTDFGIAKDMDAAGLTATHSTVGTAAYMSPEQCKGAKDITYKSDLYSMGVMFYELVTGHRPFVSENAMDVFMMHVKGKCARPASYTMDLPVWMDNLICHLMEKKPEDRPHSAAKVAEELDAIAAKVAEQKSAGLDRAVKRRADVTSQDIQLDAGDKEIARELLGKKKKKRTQPIYTRNWFTASALGGLLLAMLIGAYFVFLKAPSADRLFEQASRSMRSEATHKDAAEPIDEFLRYYPEHAKAAQVKQWRDEIELATSRAYVRNNRPAASDPKDVWSALDDEKAGRLEEARKRWQNVVALKASKDSEQRGWGLFAEQALRDLAQVDVLEKNAVLRIRNEIDFKQPATGASEPERMLFNAVRGELQEDPRRAVRAWDELKRLTDGAAEWRPYYLLALRRLRELQ